MVPSAPFQTNVNGFFISPTTTFSSTRKVCHHHRCHHQRDTRHLRAAEAKKGMLRGDPDAIKNGFFIVARSLDVRSLWLVRQAQ